MSEIEDELIHEGAAFRPHLEVVAHRLGEEVVLATLQTNRNFELNQTGARFWDLLYDGCNRSEINYANDC